jgi:hypothetical protein
MRRTGPQPVLFATTCGQVTRELILEVARAG